MNDLETRAIRHGQYLSRILASAVKSGYRNHYVTDLKGGVWRDCMILVGMGLLRKGPLTNDGKHQLFHATEVGVRIGVAFYDTAKKERK